MSQTDAMLFDNWLRDRNADAFKTLATRYAAMVYETCRRILNNPSEAEDVAQECFVILASTNKPVGEYLAPWLHRVAYNRSLVRLRAERRRKEREIRFASDEPVVHDMEWQEVRGHVDEAISELPEKLREPIVAYFLDGKTHDSIAQMLGTPRSTVTYRIDKGVEHLRKTLRGKGVVVTGAALAATMKSATSAAAPPSVLANLGRLALSGTNHVALPATLAAAPLAKTVIGAWSAKTLATTVASLAIALFAGWQVYNTAYRSGLHDAVTQTATEPLATTAAPSGSPMKAPDAPVNVASVAPTEKRKTTQTQSEQPTPSVDTDARISVARREPSLWDQAVNTAATAWDRLVRGGEGGRRTSCQNNLKQMGLVFKMFANEGVAQVFPMLDPRPGHLIFANDNPGMKPVYSEYLSDPAILVCPGDAVHAKAVTREQPLSFIDNSSYTYLGYAIRDDDELEAFAAVYKEHVSKGLRLDADLDTPRGKIYRLREGVERFFITDVQNPAAGARIQSEIPVLFEAPSHTPEGGNILYMDGHVEFMRFPNKFPMSERTRNILESLTAMKGEAAPAK